MEKKRIDTGNGYEKRVWKKWHKKRMANFQNAQQILYTKNIWELNFIWLL